MYAVIFSAEISELDKSYSETAAQLRDLAINTYGCTSFTSVTQDDREITISYWQNLEQIKNWKQDAAHLAAQKFGRSKWFKSYKVQVVEVIREYSNSG